MSYIFGSGRRAPAIVAIVIISALGAPGVGRAEGAPCAGSSTSADGEVTVTFAAVGSCVWTVPDGVGSLRVDVYGAQGGQGAHGSSFGGAGGHTQATMVVTGGQALQFAIGGLGGRGGCCLPGGGGGGGYNGGGSGGYGAAGGGGGGASDVRTGVCATDGSCGLSERVLVAGGGGGVGNVCNCGGGAGGGAEGTSAGGGGGGTQTAGGTAGPPPYGSGPTGTAGSLGSGGSGGSQEYTGGDQVFGGGGGGGGYYGGGGGGGGLFTPGSSGGGGSGYIAVNPSISDGTFETGVRTGAGMIVVTYVDRLTCIDLGDPPPDPDAIVRTAECVVASLT